MRISDWSSDVCSSDLSGLVNGQNYYTAITRARYGVKLWTVDLERLVQKLERYSGEKTSSLEGLGWLWRDSHRIRGARLVESLDWARTQMLSTRADRVERRAEREREWNGKLRHDRKSNRMTSSH